MNDRHDDSDLDGEMPFDMKFEDIKDICQRHILEGNRPYDEDEFLKIMRWIEDTMFNHILLNLVFKGKVDIVFDEDKIEELGNGEDGLLFTLTKEGKEMLGQQVEENSEPTSDISILKSIKFRRDESE